MTTTGKDRFNLVELGVIIDSFRDAKVRASYLQMVPF
jgi:hypothetical protein